MFKPTQILFPILIISLLSCNHGTEYSYAIKDFRQSLQPHLVKIVSTGIVRGLDNKLAEMMTDKELMHLSESEHPVLRASALNEVLKRRSFDHFDVLMNHLEDTALIHVYQGEFGIEETTVSDHILQEFTWKTREAISKTFDELITKHNYLRLAYLILQSLEPTEKYYPFIKDMATRSRNVDEGYEMGFNDIEYALYGLAKFKKKGDIQFIKKRLMDNVWQLGSISFQLMQVFPDTAYLEVLENYHRTRFYRFLTPNDDNTEVRVNYIKALVAQNDERSALILDTLLQRLPSLECMPNNKYFKSVLVSQIWEHPAPAYAKLRSKTKSSAEAKSPKVEDYSAKQSADSVYTTKENLRWYYK